VNEYLKSYLGIVAEEVARIVVTLLASIGLNMLLLFGFRAAWGLYSETDVGEMFIQNQGQLAVQFAYMQALPLFEFSLNVTLLVAGYMGLLALVMHLSYIRHFLYAPFPLFFKGVWVLAVSFALATLVQETLTIPEGFLVAFILTIPSVLCCLPSFLTVMHQTVPDLATAAVRTLEWFRDRVLR